MAKPLLNLDSLLQDLNTFDFPMSPVEDTKTPNSIALEDAKTNNTFESMLDKDSDARNTKANPVEETREITRLQLELAQCHEEIANLKARFASSNTEILLAEIASLKDQLARSNLVLPPSGSRLSHITKGRITKSGSTKFNSESPADPAGLVTNVEEPSNDAIKARIMATVSHQINPLAGLQLGAVKLKNSRSGLVSASGSIADLASVDKDEEKDKPKMASAISASTLSQFKLKPSRSNLGIDALGKESSVDESILRTWISSHVTFTPDMSFTESLKDGILLCKLASVLFPEESLRPSPSKSGFALKENINMFLRVIERNGIPKNALFEYGDLEGKPIKVLQTLDALRKKVLGL